MTTPSASTERPLTPLTVEGLQKSFGKHHVLQGVSLQVAPRSIVGLVGLNGVGKTTLIKNVLGLQQPDAGQCWAFGLPTSEPKARSNIAFLPEKAAPSPYLLGREYVAHVLGFYGKSYHHEEAAAMCSALDLAPEALQKTVGHYSKGMGQKLCLAATLLTPAPFLLLDEPMSGLDPRARVCLKDALRKAVQVGRAVLFSSHILADIEELCDQIVILHDGRFQFEGTPSAFVARYPEASLERSFLRSIGA